MAPQRVTIKINASAGPDAPLEVHDAMRQILDFFDLLSLAGTNNAGSISWRLVHISLNSPLEATAEAFSNYPGIPAEPIAQAEKLLLSSSLNQITTEHIVPDWMDDAVRSRARSLFERNTNGIGRTDIIFDQQQPPLIIVDHVASAALTTLARTIPSETNLSRIEFGSVEGHITGLTTYYNHPAIRIRERLGEEDVICAISDELVERIGHQHDWSEAWKGRRVIVRGEIWYKKDGVVSRVAARDIRFIDPIPLQYKDISDVNFTGGLSPAEYLERLWEDDID